MKPIFIIASLMALLAVAPAAAQTEEAPDSLMHTLQEVVVKSDSRVTRLEGATLVSTIPGSPLADLGTALDVLARLPMIKVEGSDVSVTGRSGIEIYIDGRPMRDADELRRILSTDLARVELLMAPGAAYESTTGAVIRITRRRNFAAGLSVTDQFQLQRNHRWSAMDYLSLAYRRGPWELFVDGGVNRNDYLITGTTVNTLVYDGRPTTVGSSQHNVYPTLNGIAKGGFNYASGSLSLGAYYRFNPERGDFTNTGTEWLDSDPAIARVIDRRIRAHSHLVSAYLEKSLGSDALIHFDGDFKSSTARNDVATTYPSAEAPDVMSADRRRSTLWAGKLYAEIPLAGGRLTLGTTDSYTHTALSYRMLSPGAGEYIPSGLTDARQTSAALYASWARTFGKLSLTAGARYEYVDYDFRLDGLRDDAISRRDNLLTPDVTVGFAPNPDTQLSLSYRMATVKPPYSQLTGSLSYVGAHEIEGGNPALRDERMHTLRLSGMWRGFMLEGSLDRSLDTYAFVKQLYPAGGLQLLMHPVNIDVTSMSLYLVWSSPVGRWLPNLTAGIYRQWLTLDAVRHNRPIFSYYFDNTLTLPGGWQLTANVSGQSSGDMHTNRFAATWFTMDASVGRTFLGKSLTVKLSATDIFNTSRNGWTMDTNGIHVDKRQSYDRRAISLDITYQLRPTRTRYKGSPASTSELRRL